MDSWLLSPSGAQVAITTLVDRGLVAKPLVFLGLLIGAQVARSQQQTQVRQKIGRCLTLYLVRRTIHNCLTNLELWTCLFKRPFPDYFSSLVLSSHILVGCTNHSTKKSKLPKDITPISKTIYKYFFFLDISKIVCKLWSPVHH